MKKSIFILAAVGIALILTTFGNKNLSNAVPDQPETTDSKTAVFENVLLNALHKKAGLDLVYKVDSRFNATITKEKLNKATTVLDLIPKEADWSKIAFLSMKIALLQGDDEIAVWGDDEVLTAAQIMLLQSTDYANSFYINARGKNKDSGTERLKQFGEEEYDLAYYITIVPEQEAEYSAGYHALITYLKENTREAITIIQEGKIQPCRLNFTVTQAGTIADVKLDATSGYPAIDEALVELITNMPGKWHPATNSKGEKVDQEFVFFFGLEGC